MTRRRGSGRPLPARTREHLAACDAVGLHYWAEAPSAGHIWAVDDAQHAHLVQIDRDAGTARLAGHIADEAEPYTVQDTQTIFNSGGNSVTTKENHPAQGGVAPDIAEEASPVTKIQHALSDSAEAASASGRASADPPGEVVYNPLKLDKLRSKSSVLKGVWTDPSRVPVWSTPETNMWVRVRPGEEYAAVIDLVVATNASNSGDRNPLYVATDDVRPEMERFIRPHRVTVGITYHDKVVFLWARSLGAGSNTWTDSVMKAMDEAETDWVSLESDRAHSEYKVHHSPRSKEWGEPLWPDQTLEDVVGLALRDRIIDSMDHVVVKRLLGLD
jgi:hypothetical protein